MTLAFLLALYVVDKQRSRNKNRTFWTRWNILPYIYARDE